MDLLISIADICQSFGVSFLQYCTTLGILKLHFSSERVSEGLIPPVLFHFYFLYIWVAQCNFVWHFENTISKENNIIFRFCIIVNKYYERIIKFKNKTFFKYKTESFKITAFFIYTMFKFIYSLDHRKSISFFNKTSKTFFFIVGLLDWLSFFIEKKNI